MAYIIKVKVIPAARKELITEIEPGYLQVKVLKAPEGGKANDQVVRLLANYFNVSLSNVMLKSGARSRSKVFLIG